jgi:hypothetical protein
MLLGLFNTWKESNKLSEGRMRANIPIDGLSSQELLEDWEWLLKKPHTIVAMNNFGDMFLKDEHGQAFFLNIVVGNLTKVANSISELSQLTAAKENQCRWFHTDFLTQLEQAGLTLSSGQCFGFKKPPVLGGNWELCNIDTGPIAVQVSLMGQIHQQVNALPPGATINDCTIR